MLHNLEGVEVLEILQTSFPRGGLKQKESGSRKDTKDDWGPEWGYGHF